MGGLAKITTSIVLSVLALQALSQNLSFISGKVIDSQTKEPLPYAAVYLAKTTIGTATFADGTFFLDKIPPGKFDVSVSMLGYSTYSKSILFSHTTIEGLVIELESQSKELDAVTILDSKIKRSKNAFSEFKKYFLGETRNAFFCEILNPKDVFTYKQDRKLIALTSSSQPIEIINKVLGYKIIYDLKEFEVNNKLGKITTSGIPRFEELIPENSHQREKWEYERDRAYYGSFEHFLRSLLKNELAQNFFVMKNYHEKPVQANEIIKGNIIAVKGLLYVTYTKESSEFQINRHSYSVQNSLIEFSGEPITIFENGNFEEFHNLVLYGYFGWSSHIGELLPFGYQPIHDIKSIK